MEQCRYEKLQSEIRLQRAKDEVQKLERLIAETEEQLQQDIVMEMAMVHS